MVDRRPPRQRKSTHRARTGCVVCKTRHVKCDERKPYCVQCVRLGHACHYAEPLQKVEKYVPGLVPLSNIRPAQPNPQVLVLNPCRISLTPQDSLYFDYFQTCVVPRLGSQGLLDFWHRIVLRESRYDRAAFNAILGIGAVARSKYSDSPTAPLFMQQANIIQSPSKLHYQRALEYYNRAIAEARSPQHQANPSRNFLITTLLFTVFELIQDNTKAVDALSASAIRVLQDAITQSLNTGTSALAAVIDDGSVRDAEFLLLRNTANCALFSPMYPRGREILLQTFDASPGTLPPPAHNASLNEFTEAWWRFVTGVTLWYYRVKYTIHSWKEINEDHISIQSAWWCQGKAWEAAARQRMHEETNPARRRLACNLMRGAKIIITSVACAYDTTGLLWEKHTDQLTEVLNLVDLILQESQPTGSNDAGGVLYDGMIPGLLQISWETRDLNIRSRGMEYCRRLISASTCWDVKGCFLGVSSLISAEEAGRIEGGPIPLHSRYDWTGGLWKSDYSEFQVTLTTKKYAVGLPIRNKVIIVKPKDYGLV
ncbi:hypothetical protein BX600DRAFT_470494 [Xylariales sp. PMI_506]|nr:hypothetical protein BX600DRAFT_470494 [Xylariales sp. PMI_506]